MGPGLRKKIYPYPAPPYPTSCMGLCGFENFKIRSGRGWDKADLSRPVPSPFPIVVRGLYMLDILRIITNTSSSFAYRIDIYNTTKKS